MSILLCLQGLLAVLALLAAAQRGRVLWFVAPASPALVTAWSGALAAGDAERALRLARAAPGRWGSRLVLAALDTKEPRPEEALSLLLADMRIEAQAQLAFIRVAATLSSTLGLLGGILAIQRGLSGQGLLALSAGLAQEVGLSHALHHMALGMGTAAFCFTAFSSLRRGARALLTQATQVAAQCNLWTGAVP